MADKKTGYEKAADVQATLPMQPVAQNGLPKAERKERKKGFVRRVDDDLKAMNQIDAILEKFPAQAALRILRYCQEKQNERQGRPLVISGPMPSGQVTHDPRAPGGILYTPPFPQMMGENHCATNQAVHQDRDHG